MPGVDEAEAAKILMRIIEAILALLFAPWRAWMWLVWGVR